MKIKPSHFRSLWRYYIRERRMKRVRKAEGLHIGASELCMHVRMAGKTCRRFYTDPAGRFGILIDHTGSWTNGIACLHRDSVCVA